MLFSRWKLRKNKKGVTLVEMIAAIAITDHDTPAGIPDALDAGLACGVEGFVEGPEEELLRAGFSRLGRLGRRRTGRFA